MSRLHSFPVVQRFSINLALTNLIVSVLPPQDRLGQYSGTISVTIFEMTVTKYYLTSHPKQFPNGTLLISCFSVLRTKTGSRKNDNWKNWSDVYKLHFHSSVLNNRPQHLPCLVFPYENNFTYINNWSVGSIDKLPSAETGKRLVGIILTVTVSIKHDLSYLKY